MKKLSKFLNSFNLNLPYELISTSDSSKLSDKLRGENFKVSKMNIFSKVLVKNLFSQVKIEYDNENNSIFLYLVSDSFTPTPHKQFISELLYLYEPNYELVDDDLFDLSKDFRKEYLPEESLAEVSVAINREITKIEIAIRINFTYI